MLGFTARSFHSKIYGHLLSNNTFVLLCQPNSNPRNDSLSTRWHRLSSAILNLHTGCNISGKWSCQLFVCLFVCLFAPQFVCLPVKMFLCLFLSFLSVTFKCSCMQDPMSSGPSSSPLTLSIASQQLGKLSSTKTIQDHPQTALSQETQRWNRSFRKCCQTGCWARSAAMQLTKS